MKNMKYGYYEKRVKFSLHKSFDIDSAKVKGYRKNSTSEIESENVQFDFVCQPSWSKEIVAVNIERTMATKRISDYKKTVKATIHEESHECEMCQKIFPSKNNLKNHETNVHVAERKYYCAICDKSSKTKGDMTYSRASKVQYL